MFKNDKIGAIMCFLGEKNMYNTYYEVKAEVSSWGFNIDR